MPRWLRVAVILGTGAARCDEGIEISERMCEADEAMYLAERNGRSRWAVSPAG